MYGCAVLPDLFERRVVKQSRMAIFPEIELVRYCPSDFTHRGESLQNNQRPRVFTTHGPFYRIKRTADTVRVTCSLRHQTTCKTTAISEKSGSDFDTSCIFFRDCYHIAFLSYHGAAVRFHTRGMPPACEPQSMTSAVNPRRLLMALHALKRAGRCTRDVLCKCRPLWGIAVASDCGCAPNRPPAMHS